ncbi:hypothetical protein KC867_03440 [Candidatus Saccharibacteria bacterium]|nr:hypothetical protein [Candidatus Saccharibacteria bacterium]
MSDLPKHEIITPFDRGGILPPEERVLNPDEQIQIDLMAPLADSHEVRKEIGLRGTLVATVNAGSKDFMIIDTRGTGSNRDFLIIDGTFSVQQRVGFKGIAKDKPVIIGRGHYADRFSYPSAVSRDHFEIAYNNDGLFIKNLRPTNITTVTTRTTTRQEPQYEDMRYIVDSSRTSHVEDRMQWHPNFGEKDDTAPYGYYLNHPILGRDSKSVEGGVYMGGSAREAIVVDGKSVAMQKVYKGIESDLRQSFEQNATLPLRAILLKVMDHVQNAMPYDSSKTEEISHQYHGDKLVGLSTYLERGAGVCRHQALMAAYILENLVRDGHILGEVGVERNTVEDLGGTHAWAVYKTSSNDKYEVIVVDPAQSFVGTKNQAQHEGRWEYHLTSNKY